jgi:hypothetical protein
MKDLQGFQNQEAPSCSFIPSCSFMCALDLGKRTFP